MPSQGPDSKLGSTEILSPVHSGRRASQGVTHCKFHYVCEHLRLESGIDSGGQRGSNLLGISFPSGCSPWRRQRKPTRLRSCTNRTEAAIKSGQSRLRSALGHCDPLQVPNIIRFRLTVEYALLRAEGAPVGVYRLHKRCWASENCRSHESTRLTDRNIMNNHRVPVSY
jgi:hypothetical protein